MFGKRDSLEGIQNKVNLIPDRPRHQIQMLQRLSMSNPETRSHHFANHHPDKAKQCKGEF